MFTGMEKVLSPNLAKIANISDYINIIELSWLILGLRGGSLRGPLLNRARFIILFILGVNTLRTSSKQTGHQDTTNAHSTYPTTADRALSTTSDSKDGSNSERPTGFRSIPEQILWLESQTDILPPEDVLYQTEGYGKTKKN